MTFTLVLARYLSERTAQEDSKAATTPINKGYVVAKGTKDADNLAFPQMSVVYALDGVEQEILIDKEVVSATYAYYEFSTEGLDLVLGKLRVKFTNDNGDRNLYVDKLIIDDKTYETEAHHTWSTGTWDSEFGCNYNRGGYSWSEGLHCNGYLEYNTNEPQALNVVRTPLTAKVHTDKKVELNWEYINASNIKYEIWGCDGEKCQPDDPAANNYKRETDVSTNVDIREWDGVKPKRYMLKVYQNDVLIKKSNVINLPLPVIPPPPVVKQPQADNFSQLVLNQAGDYFYYRSCDMDKTKAEGVDFTKCNNYNYSNEIWTRHSVKSLLIKEGDAVQSKLRSLDIDHRYEYNTEFDYLRNMLFYTAVSENGSKVYTRSCEIIDNQDVHNCTDWESIGAQNIGAPNITRIGSIETTTFFRDGKYYTTTKLLDDQNEYEFWSIECQTYPKLVGSNNCSAWVKDDHQASMNNYISSNTYHFETGSNEKVKESFLTDLFGTIENNLCTFSPDSTDPFLGCKGSGSVSQPSTDVEGLGIPVDHTTDVKIEDAKSISTSVSDLSRLDLPVECRTTKLGSAAAEVRAGNDIAIHNLLNAKAPFNTGFATQFQLFLPEQLEASTANSTNSPCQYSEPEGNPRYICGYGSSNNTGVYVKVKDTMEVGDVINITSRVVSGELVTTCPVLTLTVVDEPTVTNTPTPTFTPTPPVLEALTCVKKHDLVGKAWTNKNVKYRVILNETAPGPDGTVIVRDDLSEKMELVSKPDYCDLKTQEVQASVLGISDVYAENGSLLVSIVLISILSGGVSYVILLKNKDSISSELLREKPYLGGLIVTGVVLLIGGLYFQLRKDDVSPSDVPALITGNYLECNVPEGVKRISYVMKIKGVKDDVIVNTAEVQTGAIEEIESCTTEFTVTGPDITDTNTPTPTPTEDPEASPTPSFTPTPTEDPEASPTPSFTPTPTPTEPEASPTPSFTPTPTEPDSSPTPSYTPTATPIFVGFVCGAADVDNDGQFTLYDFGGAGVGYALFHRKSCDDTAEMHQTYGACGGKDFDMTGFTDLNDFSSFALRYKKPSCSLSQ